MQNAYEIQCDFSNKNGQTTKFFNDDDIINSNFSHTVDFINELGFVNRNKLDILQNPLNKNEFVWLDQDYTKVFNYLKKLKYPQQYATFNDIDKVEEWFSIEYDNGYLKDWTIVLSSNSKKSSNILTLNNIEISLPSRRKLSNSDDEFIYLKTITAPNDRLLDIDFSGLKDFDKENILYSHNDSSREKRVKYGLIDKPLLVIYIIDKDSGKNEKSNKGEDRIPLNTCNHLVGYDIFIPYGKSTNDRMDVNKVTVKLDFDTRGDIYEDED